MTNTYFQNSKNNIEVPYSVNGIVDVDLMISGANLFGRVPTGWTASVNYNNPFTSVDLPDNYLIGGTPTFFSVTVGDVGVSTVGTISIDLNDNNLNAIGGIPKTFIGQILRNINGPIDAAISPTTGFKATILNISPSDTLQPNQNYIPSHAKTFNFENVPNSEKFVELRDPDGTLTGFLDPSLYDQGMSSSSSNEESYKTPSFKPVVESYSINTTVSSARPSSGSRDIVIEAGHESGAHLCTIFIQIYSISMLPISYCRG